MSLKKQFLKAKATCKVSFRLSKNETNNADHVLLAGSFTNWEAEALEMNKLKSGDFTLVVTLPAEQEFEFRYLLNNTTWINDTEPDAFVSNEFGDQNSVVSTYSV